MYKASSANYRQSTHQVVYAKVLLEVVRCQLEGGADRGRAVDENVKRQAQRLHHTSQESVCVTCRKMSAARWWSVIGQAAAGTGYEARVEEVWSEGIDTGTSIKQISSEVETCHESLHHTKCGIYSVRAHSRTQTRQGPFLSVSFVQWDSTDH